MREFDSIRQTTIGTVDTVSAGEIRVLLEIQAPQNVALNTGIPTRFPRINGYVLIPNEVGSLVGMITYIAIEHSKYPSRKGMKDFDLIDLPYPLRKMSVTPVGTLSSNADGKYKLDRGVFSFPSVGDSVVIPSADQERAIIEIGDENAVVYIGDSAQNTGVKIKVDPDKLFGRHLAVLGNTGSGKSCTVAGLVRWALEAAKKDIGDERTVNSRFIILDPNGEYSRAFGGENDQLKSSVTRFQVHLPEHTEDDSQPFQVPAWMWNSKEWISYTRAAPGVQRPVLIDALTGLHSKRSLKDITYLLLHRALKSRQQTFERGYKFAEDYERWPNKDEIENVLKSLVGSITPLMKDVPDGNLKEHVRGLAELTKKVYKSHQESKQRPILREEFSQLLNKTTECLKAFPPDIELMDEKGPDSPSFFPVKDINAMLDSVAMGTSKDISGHLDSIKIRVNSLFHDCRVVNIINPPHSDTDTLQKWVEHYLGDNTHPGGIKIIDLSLVPSDIIHMVVAIFSRLVFESLQRYRRINTKELPTVLILEEAHTFVRQSSGDDDMSYSRLSQEIFERIAREGRKFGLGLVLSSQRPSELSQTVLAQCNTFILHRLVNDKDQDQVKRLVPDNVGALLDELPNLPTRKAIMLGWATQIPVIMNVRELPDSQRPHSADPQFWDVWTRSKKGERPMNWDKIADEWQES
ncbi:MAG: ATP-binding protein [Pedobacter sp.]